MNIILSKVESRTIENPFALGENLFQIGITFKDTDLPDQDEIITIGASVGDKIENWIECFEGLAKKLKDHRGNYKRKSGKLREYSP